MPFSLESLYAYTSVKARDKKVNTSTLKKLLLIAWMGLFD